MDIKTIADLAKLADICRKKGIKQIKVTQDGVELQLGDKPTKLTKSVIKNEVAEEPISEEDMLYWSSAGLGAGVN